MLNGGAFAVAEIVRSQKEINRRLNAVGAMNRVPSEVAVRRFGYAIPTHDNYQDCFATMRDERMCLSVDMFG